MPSTSHPPHMQMNSATIHSRGTCHHDIRSHLIPQGIGIWHRPSYGGARLFGGIFIFHRAVKGFSTHLAPLPEKMCAAVGYANYHEAQSDDTRTAAMPWRFNLGCVPETSIRNACWVAIAGLGQESYPVLRSAWIQSRFDYSRPPKNTQRVDSQPSSRYSCTSRLGKYSVPPQGKPMPHLLQKKSSKTRQPVPLNERYKPCLKEERA